MTEIETKFSKAHIPFDIVMVFYLFLRIVGYVDRENQIAFIISCFFLVLDSLVIYIKLHEKRKLMILFRYLQIVTVSVSIVSLPDSYSIVFPALLFILLLVEFVFFFDYSDSYTRMVSIGVASLPATLCILFLLIFYPADSLSAFELICILTVIMLLVRALTSFFIGWLNSFERRVFEQRRMTENAKEMNETLRVHQEKIKKANEELGIQRIKMESANRKVKKVNAEAIAQNEILKHISSTIEINDLCERITESIKNSLSLCFCAVVIFPDVVKNTEAIFHCSSNISEQFFSDLKMDVLNGAFDSQIQCDQLSLQVRPKGFCFESLPEGSLTAFLVVPIRKNGKSLGALFCAHKRPDFFDDGNQLYLNISAQILMALNNVSLYATVQQLAIRDGLTGIFNRRHLNELVEQYSKEAKEKQLPLSAALIDIDHFKKFNDSYGHVFGDHVLCRLSEIIDNYASRNGGIAARYGGEEFVIVFLGLDLSKTNDIMVMLRESINHMTLVYQGSPVNVAVSIGLTSYPEICNEPDEVLNRADLAMYYSKEHGRNRITVDNEKVRIFFRSR